MSPPSSDALHGTRVDDVRIANRIDAICDRFESAWKSGERPSISDFLDPTIGPHLSTLFVELVSIDVEYRAISGEEPSREEYAALYPQFSEILSSLHVWAGQAETVKQAVEPPRMIGKYELRKLVGKGGFGTVWKSWDNQLARWVAVKIPKEQIAGADHAAAFLREARAAAELDHPHIVPVIDSGSSQGVAFIVSRFVDGISLRQWLDARQEEMTPQDVSRLCATLGEAMDYARQKGVVHRDLKPGNVLIDAQGAPHITDFGLASRKLQDTTLEPSAAVAGTPSYMSPEQVQGTVKLDHRSDVYTLGVMLYEMLTGEVPFRGDNATLFHQIVNVEPTPLRKRNKALPADLETICLKAIRKERERRYQNSGELAADLRRYLAGEPILARRVGRPEKAWRWARRNPAVASSVSVAVVAVMAAAAMAFQPAASPVPAPGSDERLITLKTEPAGARVVFYRLDDRTGEPDPKQRIESPHRSPVKMLMPPGDYFVVAALDDGRFHEVYRRVPTRDAGLTMGGVLQWETDDDDPTATLLPKVEIPTLDVTRGMIYYAGSDSFQMGGALSTSRIGESAKTPLHVRSVDSLYADATELPVSLWKRYLGLSKDPFPQPAGDDYAARLPYAGALSVAEKLGKRLPTEAEWEYMATNGGRTRYPWGNSPPTAEEIASDGMHIVGMPTFDRTLGDPPVAGLCTNLAEWTTTYASLYPSAVERDSPSPKPPTLVADASLRRVIRGPQAGAKERRHVAVYDPRERNFEHYRKFQGVRCIRSAQPHVLATDFQSPK